MANESGKSNSMLYFVVGALVVAVLGIGYVMISGGGDKPDLAIEVSDDGIDIDSN